MSSSDDRGRGARRAGAVEWLLDHPVAATFATAFALRAVVAVVVAATRGGTLFLDDRTYAGLARAASDGRLHALGFDSQLLWDRTRTLLIPISLAFDAVGPSNLVAQLFVALLGAATAALVARLALEVVSRPWAAAAGLVAAAFPSQVLWSSLVLKDAAVWAILAGLAVLAAVAGRTTGRRLLLLGAASAVLLFLLAYLRRHTLEISCVGLVIAMALSVRRQRALRVAGAVALLAFLPLGVGMGFAGVSYVTKSRDPAQQRTLNSTGNTRVTDGASDLEGGVGSELSYLPKGASVIAVRPWPWESDPSLGMTLARAETILWYPLLVLAAIGLCSAWPRRRALAFPIAAAAGLTVVYGLTEGNLGTAYRHRGEIVWVVVLLAAVGADRLWAPHRAREKRASPEGNPIAPARRAPVGSGP